MVAKRRLRVGLLYSYNTNWIGGSYYKSNLINAFDLLPKEDKPVFVILSDRDNFMTLKQQTTYPYLEHLDFERNKSWPLHIRVINKVFRPFLKRNLIDLRIKSKDVDILFPHPPDNWEFENIKHKLYWIPDFQEAHLPEFFSKEVVENRKAYQTKLASGKHPILFSSNDAAKDFNTLYPTSKIRQHIVPFAVTHPDISHIRVADLLEKYKIPDQFYFCANQIWEHKNHITLLRAMAQLKMEGKPVNVLLSGKDFDPRNPTLLEDLHRFVEENDLKENVYFLGFIDRGDQLALMKSSVAIVQPSLFEGWSTVVEDSKALNHYIIASDLDVHKEQLELNFETFRRLDSADLAERLWKNWVTPPVIKHFDYSKHIQAFSKKFLHSIQQIILDGKSTS